MARLGEARHGGARHGMGSKTFTGEAMANELAKLIGEALLELEAFDLSTLRARYPEATDVDFGMALHHARDSLRQEHRIEFKPGEEPGTLERANSQQAYRRGRKQEHKSVRALMRSKGNYEVALAQATDPGERAMAESRRNRVADLSIDVATHMRKRARRMVAGAK